MDIEWKKLSEETYKINFREVAKWKFELPTGVTGDFDIILGRPVAAIVALTPDKQVVLAKQYRPGPEKALLELPAGIVDEGESVEDAARRELLEEVGYEGKLTHVGFTYQGGYSTVLIHSFVATDCKKIKEPHHDPFEVIETVLVSLEEFRGHVRSGQLSDTGPAYMALDHIGLL